MESVGDRIERLRTAKGWSRPELGRQMSKAIGKKQAFSGEVIRLYESDKNKPGKDARRALAAVFGKSESYIEFGSTGDAPGSVDPMFEQLTRLYGELSDDSKHAVIGYTNMLHSKENPEASAANPFPNAKPPKRPLLHGSTVAHQRQAHYSGQRGKK